jgi:hypothetical protein
MQTSFSEPKIERKAALASLLVSLDSHVLRFDVTE